MIAERLIRSYRGGLRAGFSPILGEDDQVDPVGFDFGIQRLGAGEEVVEANPKESVWILLDGEAQVSLAGSPEVLRRGSLFDELPSVVHVPGETEIVIASARGSEWAVARVRNERSFEPRIFLPTMIGAEQRGRGLAQDMSLREV